MSVYTHYFSGPGELWRWRDNDACTNMIAVAKVISMFTFVIPVLVGITWGLSSLCNRNITPPPANTPVREINNSYRKIVSRAPPEVTVFGALSESAKKAIRDNFETAFSDALERNNVQPLIDVFKGSSRDAIAIWVTSTSPLGRAVRASSRIVYETLIKNCPKILQSHLFKPDKDGVTPFMWAIRSDSIRTKWLLELCPPDMLSELLQSSEIDGVLRAPVDVGIEQLADLGDLMMDINSTLDPLPEKQRDQLYSLFMGFTPQKSFWDLLKGPRMIKFIRLYRFLPTSLRPLLFRPDKTHPLETGDAEFYIYLHQELVNKSNLTEEEKELFIKMLLTPYGKQESYLYDALKRDKGEEIERLIAMGNRDVQNNFPEKYNFPKKYLHLLLAPNSEGEPPLIWAIKNKSNLVKHLLVNKEATEELLLTSDKEGKTPLMWALLKKESDVISLLLEFSPKAVQLTMQKGKETIGAWAVKQKCKGSDIVALLSNLEDEEIQRQMKDSWKDLLPLLAKEGDENSIEWYFRHCGSVTHLDQIDSNGNTILHLAAKENENSDGIECFLKRWPKGSVVPRNHLNESPLDLAARMEKEANFLSFIEEWPGDLEDLIKAMHKALRVWPKSPDTLFGWAITCGRDDLINKLIEMCNNDVGKLAELLEISPAKQTVIYLAVQYKNFTLLKKLKIIATEHPALRPLFQQPPESSFNPLLTACRKEFSYENISELLSWYPYLINDDLFYCHPMTGRSALCNLAHFDQTGLITLVYNKCPKHLKPKLLQASKAGLTPIQYAAMHKNKNALCQLMELYPLEQLQKIFLSDPTLLDSFSTEELKGMVTDTIRGGLIFTTLFNKTDVVGRIPLIAEFESMLDKEANPLGLSLYWYDTFLRTVINAHPMTMNKVKESVPNYYNLFPDKEEFFKQKMAIKMANVVGDPHFVRMQKLAGPKNEVDEFLMEYRRAPTPSLESLKLYPYPTKSPQEGYDISLAFQKLKKQLGNIPEQQLLQLEEIVNCAKEKKSKQWTSFKEETFVPLAHHLEWIFFKLEKKSLSEEEVVLLSDLAYYGNQCPAPWCTSAQRIYRTLYPSKEDPTCEDKIHSLGAFYRQDIFSTVVREITEQAILFDTTLNYKSVRDFYNDIHYQNQFYTWLADKNLPDGQIAPDPMLPNNLDTGIFQPSKEHVRACFAMHDTDEALIHWYATHFNAEDKFDLREEFRIWMGISDDQMSNAYDGEFKFKPKFILDILVKADVFQKA